MSKNIQIKQMFTYINNKINRLISHAIVKPINLQHWRQRRFVPVHGSTIFFFFNFHSNLLRTIFELIRSNTPSCFFLVCYPRAENVLLAEAIIALIIDRFLESKKDLCQRLCVIHATSTNHTSTGTRPHSTNQHSHTPMLENREKMEYIVCFFDQKLPLVK